MYMYIYIMYIYMYIYIMYIYKYPCNIQLFNHDYTTHTLQSPCHGFQSKRSKRQVRVHTNPDGVQHLGAGKCLENHS